MLGRPNDNDAGSHFFLNNPLPEGAYSPLDRGIFIENDPEPDGNNRRRRRANPDGDDEGRGGGGNEEEEEDVPVYYSIPCSDVAEAQRELGAPGPRHKCFGCMYVGQNRAAKIPDSRLQEIFRTMADGIGVCWPSALAVQVSMQYEAWRTIINQTRGDRDPLPKWSPASILDHWTSHTCDPEIAQWLHLSHLQYTMNKIRSSSLEKRNRNNGAEIHDKEQWAIYRDAMRTYYYVSSREPRKMSYFFEGAMLDRKTVANGGISNTGRPIYNFFKKGKRQRIAGGDVNANFND